MINMFIFLKEQHFFFNFKVKNIEVNTTKSHNPIADVDSFEGLQ